MTANKQDARPGSALLTADFIARGVLEPSPDQNLLKGYRWGVINRPQQSQHTYIQSSLSCMYNAIKQDIKLQGRARINAVYSF